VAVDRIVVRYATRVFLEKTKQAALVAKDATLTGAQYAVKYTAYGLAKAKEWGSVAATRSARAVQDIYRSLSSSASSGSRNGNDSSYGVSTGNSNNNVHSSEETPKPPSI